MVKIKKLLLGISRQEIEQIELKLLNGQDCSLYLFNFNLPLNIYKRIVFDKNTDATVRNESVLSVIYYGKCQLKLKLLLSYPDIDVNVMDNKRRTPLHLACLLDDTLIVKTILNRSSVNVNTKNVFGDSPLHTACDNNNILIVRQLVNYSDINVNVKNSMLNSPIHISIFKSILIFKLLLNHSKIDVNAKNIVSNTPLHCCCTTVSNPEFLHLKARLLLNHPKIDVNSVNDKYQTPLHMACENKNYYIVEKIIQQPNVCTRDKNNISLIDIYNDRLIRMIFNMYKYKEHKK